jgi:hypothetical protein
MSISKKFKPLLSVKDVQPGKTFIKVVVLKDGVVDIKIFRLSGKPRFKSWPSGIGDSWLCYDELCFRKDAPPLLFTDKHVADAISVYKGNRYKKYFTSIDGNFYLNNSTLFPFSNKLLQKLEGFQKDPIAFLKFLNPNVVFTRHKIAAIRLGLCERNYKIVDIEPKNNYFIIEKEPISTYPKNTKDYIINSLTSHQFEKFIKTKN